jgi:HKD family nuclease
MQLIAGPLNGQTLSRLNDKLTPMADEILVAVAYAGYDCQDLFKLAEQHGTGVAFYGRYDESVPVAPAIIKWFLDREHVPNLVCRMVADFYHPKVIWWKKHGVYIGSANLTNRAWIDNIELGTFHDQSEIESSGLDEQLAAIFSEIEERSHAISKQFHNHLVELAKANKPVDDARASLNDKFDKMRFFPKGEPLSTTVKKTVVDRAKERFQAHRLRTMELLSRLEAHVTADENRPHWIPATSPMGVQVDQFLYAYHVQFVGAQSDAANVEVYHKANANRLPESIAEAMAWWRDSLYNVEYIDRMVNVTAPLLQRLLSKDKLPSLTSEEFHAAVSNLHAIQQTVMNRSNKSMGLPPEQTMETKLRRHAEQLWSARSPEGKTALETFNYMIWGSDNENIETRLWNASQNDKWALPWTRVNTLTDMLGWARPDDFPPVNGRTVKALRALGYEIDT